MHEFVESKRDALLELCRHHRLRRLDLFGSATTADFDPETGDLDFLVELEDLEPAAYLPGAPSAPPGTPPPAPRTVLQPAAVLGAGGCSCGRSTSAASAD